MRLSKPEKKIPIPEKCCGSTLLSHRLESRGRECVCDRRTCYHPAARCLSVLECQLHSSTQMLPVVWSGEETVAGQRRAGERVQPGWLSLGEWGQLPCSLGAVWGGVSLRHAPALFHCRPVLSAPGNLKLQSGIISLMSD